MGRADEAMYNLMFFHTDNHKPTVLAEYASRERVQRELRRTERVLRQQVKSCSFVVSSERVELRFRLGGGCAYYIEKAA